MKKVKTSIHAEINAVINHEFFLQLKKGAFTKDQIKVYAEQYYLLSKAFVEFLLLGSLSIKDDDCRSAFIKNLFDEHGKGNNNAGHRVLLEKFVKSTGGNINNIYPFDKTSVYIHGMKDLCRSGSQLEILGALGPSCEFVTQHMYRTIYNSLKNIYKFNDENLIFFKTHIDHDPSHEQDIEDTIKCILTCNDNKAVNSVISGAKQSLILEKIFWDGVYENV
jgi:pyrroloquinoline quinone (PQQ) biosynthesis protein C